MRELIALRAKIDLHRIDWNKFMVNDHYAESYIDGYNSGLIWVCDMIDEMVSKQLEAMYDEHIQEETAND